MASQLLPLLRNELTKAARRKLPYFGLGAIGLLCVIIYFVAGRISQTTSINAWGYVSLSMQLAFADLGPVFVLVFASMLVAEETGTGTIRAALAAPVHRWELYVAKAITGLLYMIAVSTAALVYSIALAKLHYDFGAVGDSFGIVYSRGQTLRLFLLGFALSWIPLAALVAYGLLISTLVRNPGAAVAAAISTLFIIDFTKHLVGIDAYVFTRYIEYSWLVVKQAAEGMDYQWAPAVWRMIALSAASAVLAFGTGLVLFVRRDLNH